MTTAIPEPSHPIDPERKELPPVERLADKGPSANDAAYGAAPHSTESANDESFSAHGALNEAAAPKTHSGPTVDPANPPGRIAKSIAHWIHQHPEAHKHGAGSLVYQYTRSLVASIPYGISMALVLAGFTGMARKGDHLAEHAASGFGKSFGRNMSTFAKFGPARAAALIGTSFTFYRGTSKLGKWMTEYLFNPKDSEAYTAEKVDDLVPEAWRKIKEIAPAESSSTPISAVVLGFITSAFAAPYDKIKNLWVNKDTGAMLKEGEAVTEKFKNIAWTQDNFRAAKGLGKLRLMWDVIAHPKAKFLSHAVINTFGYALFFELGDRLFKDVQIRRGVWPGEHNSIKALKAAPDEYEKGIHDGIEASKPKFDDGAAQAAPEKHHYAFFDSEPSLGRFVFRRLLPTAAGITLYTAAKMRWAGMTFNNFDYGKADITLKEIGKKAVGEGLATSLFFLIPIISEPWEKIYDNFFERKEKIAQAKDHEKMAKKTKELNPHQQAMHEQVLDKLNAKEQVASRSA